MHEAIPMCVMCDTHEVGTFGGGSMFFCGQECEKKANRDLDEMYASADGSMGYEFDELRNKVLRNVGLSTKLGARNV